MKPYISLLDRISEEDSKFFCPFDYKDDKEDLAKFSWTIFQALHSTRKLFRDVFTDLEIESTEIAELLFMNTRIVRGILDYKNCPAGVQYHLHTIIPTWVDMSLWLYQWDKNTLEKLNILEKNLEEVWKFEMLQRFDPETWTAMNPYYCEKTAQALIKEIGRGEFVFIALWHGGILPWVDVYLRLISKLSQESLFYPIRFSRAKKKDKIPRIDEGWEFVYLSEALDDRVLVIFDEDASSGNTLLKAETYFYEKFPSLKRVLKVSNIGKFAPK